MGFFLGIAVILITVYIINKFDIKHKFFLIGLVLGVLILGGVTILEIHNPQAAKETVLYELSEDLLDGNLSDRNKNEAMSLRADTTFFLIIQTICLKMFNRITFFKLFNLVLYIFIILLIYRIINRISGKKYAQIFTSLYVFFVNPFLYNLVLSSGNLVLFLTLLAFDLLFEENLIKNSFIRIAIVSLIFSIATLLDLKAIIVPIVYLLFKIVEVILKKETLKLCIFKIVTFSIVYFVVAIVVISVMDGLINFSGIEISIEKYINSLKEYDLSCKINNINEVWNNVSNENVLKYLNDTNFNVIGIKVNLGDVFSLIENYSAMIWYIIVLIALLSIIYRYESDERYCYFIYMILGFMSCLFIQNNVCAGIIYRPYVFILASIGFKNLNTFLGKEKGRNCIERAKKIKKSNLFKIVVLLLLCMYLTCVSLQFSVGELGKIMYESYFDNIWILLLNFLPILFIAIITYIVTMKTSISFAITALISFAITMINYVKMGIRNDNFLMEDIFLIREAATTKFDYSIMFDANIIMHILFFVILSLLLYIFIDRDNIKRKKSLKRIVVKVILIVFLLFVGLVSLNKVYVSDYFYEKTKNEKNYEGAMWTDRNKYISRGCLYSFLHSYTSIKSIPPEGYDKGEAGEKLYSYEYSNIEDDKKVNIIAIMLESYNDFSKFEEIEFVNDPYEKFHEIEKESISGELVTSIFGGGTINTERKFLTGASQLPDFRKKTNSYVRYLKEQGYVVEGSHPAKGWFYNRNTVNANLGFDNYWFEENKYGELSPDIYAPDYILMRQILNLYNQHKENSNQPYFSFTVTYQNHLPYNSTNLYGSEYVAETTSFNGKEYYTFNNYLEGIKDTGDVLYNMVEQIKTYDEPVVLIVFGDHNPSLGDVYDKLGINIDISNDEGIDNYYSTPYFIFANNTAKEVLDNDFVGDGEKVSPNFLMNEFFKLAGYGGNEFMKVSNELEETISVISNDFYYENDVISRELSDENKKKLNDYLKIEYYYMNEFKNK